MQPHGGAFETNPLYLGRLQERGSIQEWPPAHVQDVSWLCFQFQGMRVAYYYYFHFVDQLKPISKRIERKTEGTVNNASRSFGLTLNWTEGNLMRCLFNWFLPEEIRKKDMMMMWRSAPNQRVRESRCASHCLVLLLLRSKQFRFN